MQIDAEFEILWDYEFFEKYLVALTNLSYRPKTAHKYNKSIKDL